MRIYNVLNIEDIESELKQKMVKTIASNIKNARLKQSMTIEKASEKAGISATFWSELERAIKVPSSLTLIKIANALDVSVCSIIPADYCPLMGDDTTGKLRRMLVNREDKDIQKIMKILEIYFE